MAPLPGNRALLGLDITTQPANLAAARFSRDADLPVMSAAFQLVQRSGMPGPNDGITIRLPVFSTGPQPANLPSGASARWVRWPFRSGWRA